MNTELIKIEKQLARADIEFSASFVHGLLTAFSCDTPSKHNWAGLLVDELNPKDIMQKDALTYLKTVQVGITELIALDEFSFKLLIDDDAGVGAETESTIDWASGFWLGVQKIGLENILKDEQSVEFFRDLKQITMMPIPDFDSKEDEVETQKDLFEIQEYLRMLVISLYLSSWQN